MNDMSGQAVFRTVIDRRPDGRIAAEGFEFPEERRLELAQMLKRHVKGEVRFSDGDRALYATDSSNYRQVPLGVVLPKSADDAATAIRICADYDAPVTPRGGGTSLAGQTCNTAVIIDFSKYMHRVLSIDPDRKLAEVEPGCILDTLRSEAEKHHLTFGPDPSTHSRNTLGGMIGNDSCGVHSVMAGRTADNVHTLDIITYDGLRMTVGPTSKAEYEAILAEGGRRAEIYRGLRELWDRYGAQFENTYPHIPRRVSGYENLDQLCWGKGFNVARALVGTEAGCVMVLKATLNLVESPPKRMMAILGFKDVFTAADHVCEALKYDPIALEGMDGLLIDYLRRKHMDEADIQALPKGRGWLIAEFGGQTVEEAHKKAQKFVKHFRGKDCEGAVLDSLEKQAHIWKVREDGLPATTHVPGLGDTYPGWEDSAVRREDLGDYLRDLVALFKKYGYEASVYGHFGGGLIHCSINFDLLTENGVEHWRKFLDEAADLVLKYGGSFSGEHGDGQARGDLLVKMYGPELMAAQREFKAIWDPRSRMNPGKVIDPYPITSNLRLSPTFRPGPIPGRFAYPKDDGDFVKTVQRCVGVGACRIPHSDKQVMCPSYMATREEKHSTRGRARLLFEMVHGGAITDGWKSREVEEALDLCLGCKGCKADCPVHVDMASYKADFRSRHYEHRMRPRAAYAMGQIRRWAEMASRAPWLANAVMRAPGVSNLAKAVGGVAQERTIPAFAAQTFRAWWRARAPRSGGGKRVVLWADTFNDFFRPNTAVAAVGVLEGLGYEVHVPAASLCCGRPLYDWGWLDQAKGLWRKTLNVLAREIEAGTPVVGLEPACVSAFRDELPGLFPNDPAAAKLSQQTLFLTEFLDREGCDLRLPTEVSAKLQVHCHHHAVLDPKAELRVLKRAGVAAEAMPSGCCGMAGAFGFEAAKYEVSMTAGERVLLPEVRATPEETLILADGFSCREQIEQGAGRQTLHVAELLARAL